MSFFAVTISPILLNALKGGDPGYALQILTKLWIYDKKMDIFTFITILFTKIIM